MFKAEMQVVNDKGWYSNALTFDTADAAEKYARDLFSRWTATTGWRVVDVDGKVFAQSGSAS